LTYCVLLVVVKQLQTQLNK